MTKYFKDKIDVSVNNLEPVKMSLEEAVEYDKPEGMARTIVSVTFLKRLLDAVKSKPLKLG